MAKTKVAMLVAPKKVEMQEFEIPSIGDDEMIVKVEGCGICGTDVHEYKGDPFGYCPVVLGHEGSGEIVAIGKNIAKDTAGKPVKIGDKIVTSVIKCGTCPNCMRYPERVNLCNNLGVYGLIPDDNKHLNGWFADHILVRANSTFFVVNDMTLDERLLLEPATVVVHAYHRAKSTNLLTFNSNILVQGLGPIGLLQLAVLKAAGFNRIIAVDGNEKRLKMAKKMGADIVIDFTKFTTIEERVAEVEKYCDGIGADFVFQCTGSPRAAADAYKYVRRGGGMCELGFFVNNGECTMNPHFDLCNKEITLVGSWVYSAQEYMTTMEFFKRAKSMGIPFEELVTHKFPLEELSKAMETNMAMEGIKIAIVNK